jgi:hypothetical protein
MLLCPLVVSALVAAQSAPAPDAMYATADDEQNVARSAVLGAVGGFAGGVAGLAMFGGAWLATRDAGPNLTRADVVFGGGAAIATAAAIAFFAGASVDVFAFRNTPSTEWLALTGCVAGGVLALVLAPLLCTCAVVACPLLLFDTGPCDCGDSATSGDHESTASADDDDIDRLATRATAGALAVTGMAIGFVVATQPAHGASVLRDRAMIGLAAGAVVGGALGGAFGGAVGALSTEEKAHSPRH